MLQETYHKLNQRSAKPFKAASANNIEAPFYFNYSNFKKICQSQKSFQKHIKIRFVPDSSQNIVTIIYSKCKERLYTYIKYWKDIFSMNAYSYLKRMH